MNTQEKLQRIRAKCVELLAIAEKRTQGKWKAESSRAYCADEDVTHNVVGPPSDYMYLQEFPDAAFIAACAGAAEAGWKSTIAAIDGLLPIAEIGGGRSEGNFMAQDTLNTIIAAWPEELL